MQELSKSIGRKPNVIQQFFAGLFHETDGSAAGKEAPAKVPGPAVETADMEKQEGEDPYMEVYSYLYLYWFI